jgi:hypothetical protein
MGEYGIMEMLRKKYRKGERIKSRTTDIALVRVKP